MRLWSIHPSYLDPKGLVALWREGLLAQAVLEGKTKGYVRHPQLQRFRAHAEPLVAISAYLWAVHDEAAARGYAFDAAKLTPRRTCAPMPVTQGQLDFEWKHLLAKLSVRNPDRFQRFQEIASPSCHPLFDVCPGSIESWERNATDEPRD